MIQRALKKKEMSVALRVGVTLLLFALLFKSVSWSMLFATLIHAHTGMLLVGLLIGGIGVVISSYQWQLLLRAERIVIGLVRLIKLYVVGIAFSHFLPTGMGGDAVKMLYVGREADNGVGSASAVVMSRITGFVGMVLVALPVLALWYTQFTRMVIVWFVLLSVLVGGMICVAVFAALLLPRLYIGRVKAGRLASSPIVTAVLRVGTAISTSARRPRSVGAATLFGVLFWIFGCLNYYSYAIALQVHVPLYFYFVAIPLVSLVTFLPISINGFGVREGAFVAVFATAHVPVATALLLALLVDAQVLLFGALGGYIYLTMSRKGQSARQIEPAVADIAEAAHASSATTRIRMNEKHLSDAAMSDTDTTFSPPEDATIKANRLPAHVLAFAAAHESAVQKEQVGPSTPLPPPVEQEEQMPFTHPQGHTPPVATGQPQDTLSEDQIIAPPMGESVLPRSTKTEQEPAFAFPPMPRSAKASGRKRRLALVLGALICLLVLLGAIGVYEITQAAPAVTAYHVPSQDVSQTIGGGGIVFPRQQLDISYSASERVVAVLVKEGDVVAAHQPLIQLDGAQLRAEIAQAADDLAAAAIYLNNVEATGNSLNIAQAKQAYNIAKDKYDALVAKSQSPILENDTLISPMKGVVTNVNVNPGQVFASNTPLMTIMDESTVIVHVKVPLSNLRQVHVGQAAIVTPSALPTLDFHGTVSTIIPTADPQTDTFEVWVDVPNINAALLPGMSAFVRIQGTESKALVLPRLAVLNPDRESIVFVVRDAHAYIEHVHIVGRSGDTLFVDAGIAPGDTVVLVGAESLQNGQPVRVTHMES